MTGTRQGIPQNSVCDPVSATLAILETLSWQTRNGLHSPHTPSFLASRVRILEECIELKIDAAKGDSQDVNVFADVVKPSGAPLPGLSQFDPNRVVSQPYLDTVNPFGHGFS